MPIDPVCGMKVDEKKAKFSAVKDGKKYYFCSYRCKEKFDTPIENKPWAISKIIPVVLVVILIFMGTLSYLNNFMPKFMGVFFIIVAVLKMLDWKGFADSFGMYDVIAKKSRAYAQIYPAVEFVLGVFYLSGMFVKPAAFATFLIMSVGTIGVAKNLMSKNPVKCACLGTLINIPLTKFTLVEDILMAVMSIMVLFL